VSNLKSVALTVFELLLGVTFNLVTLSLFSFVWCVLLLYVSVLPTAVIKID